MNNVYRFINKLFCDYQNNQSPVSGYICTLQLINSPNCNLVRHCPRKTVPRARLDSRLALRSSSTQMI
ncbi:hypothetical protein E2C01_038030 [Portunus trituberculatus]|uniref:Uncharacterized protein n=1 Tax=Portunus trituberculatus TaxID=210409 RepID=A0A5B7FHF7_PORTR|nr:hypothetical protein [Portunus trituberculatus]